MYQGKNYLVKPQFLSKTSLVYILKSYKHFYDKNLTHLIQTS